MTQIATLIFLCGICAMLWLDRERKAKTSLGLWAPFVWVFIGASRPVSMWLGFAAADTPDEILDGSPADRNAFLIMLLIGLVVLVQRSARTQALLRKHPWLVAYFIYCGISVIWSDFPFVALKRWIKFVGDLVMVLVVLTERDPLAAFHKIVARLGYTLIPLSILFIKYYPDLGRGYDRWTYTPIYIGVTYNKNLLGMTCLVIGVGFLWRLVQTWQSKMPGRTGILAAQGFLFFQVIYLLSLAHSATSSSCFAMGCVLVLAMAFRFVEKRPAIVHCLSAALIGLAFSALFLDLGSSLVESMGRNSTLTGRTELWERIMKMTGNPLLGTGFDSFWLGDRLQELWKIYWWQPNEAHNGYIEVFLNLGIIGVFMLLTLIFKGYGSAIRSMKFKDPTAGLRVAFFVVSLAYNFTEAAFKMVSPVWFFVLVAAIGIPRAVGPINGSAKRKPANQITDEPRLNEDLGRGMESWSTA